MKICNGSLCRPTTKMAVAERTLDLHCVVKETRAYRRRYACSVLLYNCMCRPFLSHGIFALYTFGILTMPTWHRFLLIQRRRYILHQTEIETMQSHFFPPSSSPTPPLSFFLSFPLSPLTNKQCSLLHAWGTRNHSPPSVRRIAGGDGCVSQSALSHLSQVLCVLQVI